jgi:hypothetical protein
MIKFNSVKNRLLIASIFLLSTISLKAHAITATFDPATGIADLPVVEVLNGASSTFFSAQLQLTGNELQLIGANQISPATGERNVFDAATNAVHISSINVGADEFYVKLRLVPGSDPLRFTLDQVASNTSTACPDFSTAGPTAGSCILSGEILNRDIILTKNIQWILSGGVFIGGDNTNSSTITINPGTQIFGQQGADFLWIRRGSQIFSEGTPDNPVVMSGPLQQIAGEWGGLVVTGNAPVNGCNEDVALCEIPFEAITSEFMGGNDPTDNSGIIKYTQILFAGFAVRPNEELNGLTLNAVGSGTLIQFVHVHAGLDDGVEMFGGTVQMKHLVLTDINDDSLDWGLGWQGRAQFILVEQASDDGDRGIEADNNTSGDLQPRSKPILSNMTLIGAPVATQGALLRRGTGASIWNSVFTGFPTCLQIDGAPTYVNAGTPGNLTGELTIQNSFVNCPTNFADGEGATFTTADWFLSQPGNVEGDPLLNGFLPATGSPLTLGGAPVNDPFFDVVDYAGAFKDESDDWTQEWTFNLN